MIPLEADLHEKVLSSCLSTSLSSLDMCVPITWGWLRLGVDQGIKMLLGVLSFCRSLSQSLLLTEEINKLKETYYRKAISYF